MSLGAFSVSLSVQDIKKSKVFYEALGFTVMHGDETQHWLLMKNGETVIGLFQGMFEKNILTFNPGWDQQANELDSFKDIREIQKELKQKGLQLVKEISDDDPGAGPADFTLIDPDGNPILFDQHR